MTLTPARRHAALAALLLLGGTPAVRAQQAQAPPLVAGWIERVSLPDQGLEFAAKLDTGADSSSINARGITRGRRSSAAGGELMVRFDVVDDGGRPRTIEAPVVRRVRIRRSGDEGDRRDVVRLRVCVAGITTEAEFTLADRSGLDYQVLIGRNVLAGRILVDSARRQIASDRCGAAR